MASLSLPIVVILSLLLQATISFAFLVSSQAPSGKVVIKATTDRLKPLRAEATDEATESATAENSGCKSGAGIHLFFDIDVAKKNVGRLVFRIPDRSLLPLHIENVIKLCTQERASIDPRCKYVGCEFQHSPQFVEGFAQYRWSHILKGRGRNAVGRAEDRISDPENMSKCAHSIYGGQYYGLNYDKDIPKDDKDTAVVLTVPLVGPGRGFTDLCIVRISESPREWKERLLLNSAVLGWMEPSSMDALRAMARQTDGAPTVVDSGVL